RRMNSGDGEVKTENVGEKRRVDREDLMDGRFRIDDGVEGEQQAKSVVKDVRDPQWKATPGRYLPSESTGISGCR
ncbi:hypothetical protein, partial [Salmonella enterica]|uniref:hypothetical protein n=1 Tax=Salmonella enterica TaxID=28901 RepID=UPI00398C334C